MENELQTKIFREIKKRGLAGLVVFGNENITYLSQVVFPYEPSYPDKNIILILSEEKSTIICGVEYREMIKDQKWCGDIECVDGNYSKKALKSCIATALEKNSAKNGKWGYDADCVSCNSFALLKEVLSAENLTDATGLLHDLRIIKEASEIEKLSHAIFLGDRAVISTLNHTEGTQDATSYSRAESAERMRVHFAEFGGCSVGHLTALQGDDIGRFYGMNHDRITEGEFARYDITGSWDGYWTSSGRTIWVGRAPKIAKIAYQDNLTIKNFIVSKLVAGNKCSDIYIQALEKAQIEGVRVIASAGFGYGVGTSEREAPFINPDDDTVLAPNMVIAVDVYSEGPKKEWIHSIDIYQITDGEPKCLSDYKEYDYLYEMFGITARHG